MLIYRIKQHLGLLPRAQTVPQASITKIATSNGFSPFQKTQCFTAIIFYTLVNYMFIRSTRPTAMYVLCMYGFVFGLTGNGFELCLFNGSVLILSLQYFHLNHDNKPTLPSPIYTCVICKLLVLCYLKKVINYVVMRAGTIDIMIVFHSCVDRCIKSLHSFGTVMINGFAVHYICHKSNQTLVWLITWVRCLQAQLYNKYFQMSIIMYVCKLVLYIMY